MIPVVEVFQQLDSAPVLVGRAHFSLRRGEISTSFGYDDAYVSAPDSFAIDPSMPLGLSPFHTQGLPGAFRDSSPDRWGRRIVARLHRDQAQLAGAPARTLDEVDYLLGAFWDTRQGALLYRSPGADGFLSPSPGVPPLVQLPKLLAASRHVGRDEAGHDEIKMLLDAGTGSLGGARPKASVLDGDRLLLAKFPHDSDEWNIMAWEKTALDLAQKAGIPVPWRRMVNIGNSDVLLLERFDRQAGMLEGARIPYISAMSLLGGKDGESYDYAEVAEALVPFVGDSSEQIEALLRRIALSVALHNVDDHLRNTGFIRIGGKWRLSPAFDVNPEPYAGQERATLIYGEAGGNEVNGLILFCEELGVTRHRAYEIIRDVLGAMTSWQEIARSNGCPERELRMFEPVFRDRCSALREAFKP